mmetsp:Transcript_20828/g.26977  ORF Transcript_20828/g.26977 Transcript_20828/m.26977 type:complete len:468 (+) Transcript_20828:432-1835(+)
MIGIWRKQKKNYRLLCLKHHPDKNRGNEKEAAERTATINKAMQDIKNFVTSTQNDKDDHYSTSSDEHNEPQETEAQKKEEKKNTAEEEKKRTQERQAQEKRYNEEVQARKNAQRRKKSKRSNISPTTKQNPMDLCTNPAVLVLAINGNREFLQNTFMEFLRDQDKATLVDALATELDSAGNSLLHYAAYYNSIEAVELIMRLAAKDWIDLVLKKNVAGLLPSEIKSSIYPNMAIERLRELQNHALDLRAKRNKITFDFVIAGGCFFDLFSAWLIIDAFFLRTFCLGILPPLRFYCKFLAAPCILILTFFFKVLGTDLNIIFFWIFRAYFVFWPVLFIRTFYPLWLPALIYFWFAAHFIWRGSQGPFAYSTIEAYLYYRKRNQKCLAYLCHSFLQRLSYVFFRVFSFPPCFMYSSMRPFIKNTFSASCCCPSVISVFCMNNATTLQRLGLSLEIDLTILLLSRFFSSS